MCAPPSTTRPQGLHAPDRLRRRRARARGRRRRAARGLLAAIPAAGVIAGIGIAAHGGGATAHDATGPVASAPVASAPAASAPAPSVQTDAYVIRHIEAVLGSADKFIIKTSAVTGPGQTTTSYLDPVTGTTRSVVSGAGDKVAYWIKTRVAGGADHWQTTYVDYTTRTWWTRHSHSGKLGSATDNAPVLSAQTLPSQVSKALAAGELRIAVKGPVDGHLAIELQYAGALADKAAAVHYWVDATTFQPVQIDLPPFTAASRIAESWVPKSSALVKQTDTPQVPKLASARSRRPPRSTSRGQPRRAAGSTRARRGICLDGS